MKKFRIVHRLFEDGTEKFKPQYFMGEKELETVKSMGCSSNGWIDISDFLDNEDLAIDKIEKHKNPTITVTVLPPPIKFVDTIIEIE